MAPLHSLLPHDPHRYEAVEMMPDRLAGVWAIGRRDPPAAPHAAQPQLRKRLGHAKLPKQHHALLARQGGQQFGQGFIGVGLVAHAANGAVAPYADSGATIWLVGSPKRPRMH